MQAQTIPVSQALGMEVSGKGGNEAKRRRREVDGLEGRRAVGRSCQKKNGVKGGPKNKKSKKRLRRKNKLGKKNPRRK
jgi:hypothetical protein